MAIVLTCHFIKLKPIIFLKVILGYFVKFYSCHYFQPYGMKVASPFLGKRVLSSEHPWYVRITTYIVGNRKTIPDVHS